VQRLSILPCGDAGAMAKGVLRRDPALRPLEDAESSAANAQPLAQREGMPRAMSKTLRFSLDGGDPESEWERRLERFASAVVRGAGTGFCLRGGLNLVGCQPMATDSIPADRQTLAASTLWHTTSFAWFVHPVAAAVCHALNGAALVMRTPGPAMSSAHPLPLQAALLFALLARRRKAAQAKRGGVAAQVPATLCLMASRYRRVLQNVGSCSPL
jgi:hypothetical protein